MSGVDSNAPKVFRAGAILLATNLAVEVIDWWRRLDFLRQSLADTAATNWLFRADVRLALLVFGLVFVYFGRSASHTQPVSTSPPTKPKLQPPMPPVEASFDTILGAVHGRTDLAATEALRSSFPTGILLTGHLSGVDHELWGYLVNPTGDAQVRVVFDISWRAALTLVPPGQLVSIRGTVDRVRGGNIEVRQCELVRTVPGSEVNYTPYDLHADLKRKGKLS